MTDAISRFAVGAGSHNAAVGAARRDNAQEGETMTRARTRNASRKARPVVGNVEGTAKSPQNYQSSIQTNVAHEQAFAEIGRVAKWWNKRVTGSSEKIGDRFKVDFGPTWVEFRVVESVANQKIVWEVTDCYLHWIHDKTEWTGTKIVWELEQANAYTKVTMTHVGLTPAAECFDACEAGWNFYVGESLLKLFTEGRGMPDRM